MERLLPLEGLRAVCVLSIVVGHQWDFFLERIDGLDGNTSFAVEYLQAVTLFFILSGIPLAELYGSKSDYDWGRAEARKRFWLRRVFRLAPSYYLGLFLGCLATCCGQLEDFQRFYGISLLASVFMVQSWLLAVFVNPPLWQVSVFFACYLLYPRLVRYFTSFTLDQLYYTIIKCVLLSLFLLIAGILTLGPYFALAWHFHPLSRIPFFIAGVCVGELVARLDHTESTYLKSVNVARRTDILSCILLLTAVITVITWRWSGRTKRIAASLLFESFGAPIHVAWLSHLVIAYDPSRQPWSNRLLLTPILQAIGRASFSIYCIHFPVLRMYNHFVRSQTQNPGGGAPIIGIRVVPTYHFFPQLALVLALGFAVHHGVARPARTAMVRRWAPKNLGQEEHLELIEAAARAK